jgi:hypothetical protein
MKIMEEKIVKIRSLIWNTSGVEWHTLNLLKRLQCESKMEIMEELEIGARSLARSTSGVEGYARALGWD